jgi:hypothetical protein
VLLTFHSALRKLYTEPSIGASYQVSNHLANQKQELPVAETWLSQATLVSDWLIF